MSRSLREIWVDVLEGDRESWGELVSQYTKLVYSVSCRNGLSKSDAEDCTQQTWMALYNSRFRIKDIEKIPFWLASTAYRRAMRIHRKKKSIENAESNPVNIEQPLTPYEHVIYLRKQEVLKLALDELDERCRKLLTELFFAPEELSYKDISKKLKIPINSLGPTRNRCLKKMKTILENFGIDEYENEF